MKLLRHVLFAVSFLFAISIFAVLGLPAFLISVYDGGVHFFLVCFVALLFLVLGVWVSFRRRN